MDSTRIKRRISFSQEAFSSAVWPKISRLLGGGEIVPVESVTDATFAKEYLDMFAGIDCWHVCKSQSQMRGIASRVQWTQKLFKTFTIRFSRPNGGKTEYEKRLESIRSENGWIRPSLVIQSYFLPPRGSSDKLRAVAIARMDDVIDVIASGERGTKGEQLDWYLDSTNPDRYAETDLTSFAVVPLSTLVRLGKKCKWLEF